MDYRIESKSSLIIQGLSRRISTENDVNLIEVPNFWNDFEHMPISKSIVEHIGPLGLIGVCYNNCKVGLQYDYMIGVEANKEIDGNTKTLEIPSSTWAIFTAQGKIPESIQLVWKEILDDFFVKTRYRHSRLPELEIYPEGDTNSKNYTCEIWIPIVDWE